MTAANTCSLRRKKPSTLFHRHPDPVSSARAGFTCAVLIKTTTTRCGEVDPFRDTKFTACTVVERIRSLGVCKLVLREGRGSKQVPTYFLESSTRNIHRLKFCFIVLLLFHSFPWPLLYLSCGRRPRLGLSRINSRETQNQINLNVNMSSSELVVAELS